MVAEESALRGGLLPGLLGALRHNVGRRNPWLRLFEIGDVFALGRDRRWPWREPSCPRSGSYVGLILAELDDDARRGGQRLAGGLRCPQAGRTSS